MPSNPRPVVLVAEDHPVNQKVIALLLTSLGVDGDIVNNGLEAVAAAKPNHYALILMDIMMPEMDGFQAAFEIRQMEFDNGSHTPIIACTAMDKDYVRDQCIRSGIDDYIGKPVIKSVLKQKIETWSNVPIKLRPIKEDTELTVRQMASLVTEQFEPIDRTTLDLLYGFEQLDDILVLFQTITETLLAQLESAIKNQDVMLVRRMAHEIKGSSYVVSAREMANVCLQLEQAGEQQNWSETERLYASLGLAFARVREFLSEKQRYNKQRHDKAS